MARAQSNSFGSLATLQSPEGPLRYHRLQALAEQGLAELARWPYSLRILLEALLRNEDGFAIRAEQIARLLRYDPRNPEAVDLPFTPSRVLLQDFTGVPAVVDLAAMRSAMQRLGGDPERINPRVPVDLVVDHSVQVDAFGSAGALRFNTELEFQRNRERYEFLRWGQQAFRNFRVVPPMSGICHQVNLEYLAPVVGLGRRDGETFVFPDTLVGTDSHTPMVNGLGVLGWGVGGIEAEAVMLGQPLPMLAPRVVGVRLTGSLGPGVTATDLVLTVTDRLRRHGVVGKFVEFCGPGLAAMAVPDRATLANMAPEYGATVGFFPVDDQTLAYLRGTGRPAALVERVERYCKEQGLFRSADATEPLFAEELEIDLASVVSSLAGPKRPQDRVALGDLKASFASSLQAPSTQRGFGVPPERVAAKASVQLEDGSTAQLGHGAVVIAAITSCTNTSNPSVMLAAGLLAKKAVALGLQRKPWVKSSLAPGSTVVTEYLRAAQLLPALEALGFDVVGYGCTTCIGNSGPLPEPVARAVDEQRLVAAAVLSGNRNFEGRINPRAQASYLASPPLVVAYALAGTVDIDLLRQPLGRGLHGQDIYLADIWPTAAEVASHLGTALDPELFRRQYSGIENSNETWNAIPAASGGLYPWDEASDYIQEPPFFVGMGLSPDPPRSIRGARVLVVAGDSLTTDHISPAGNIAPDSPAGRYLVERGVAPADFNSYGSRRGNDRVMTRGTFANIRLKNRLLDGVEGGVTEHLPSGERVSIFEAARRYQAEGTPTVVLGGRDYGMGSSRDWAAKGTLLLGVRAVIAESYERIHRSNLAGMGVLPLEFLPGQTAASLGLTGRETFDIELPEALQAGQLLDARVTDAAGQARTIALRCRLDSSVELAYYANGGVLQTVLRRFLEEDRVKG